MKPDPTTLSNTLCASIRHAIQQNDGEISFAQFMELALYTPELGYYCSSLPKFGKTGDFITAPLLTPVFAQCLAQQCKELLAHLPQKTILEFGAGTGQLAADILQSLEQTAALPDHYYIVEISHALRNTQRETLAQLCPHLLNRVSWLDEMPTELIGIIIGNEVLDALPVHLFQLGSSEEIFERCVTIKNDQFAWSLKPAENQLYQAVKSLCQQLTLPKGYASEVHLNQRHWIKSVAEKLQKGMILLFDYGYEQKEYYRPERNQGTLTCFYQHTRNSTPLIHVGLQDITAHIDFTALAETAASNQLTVAGYTTQAAFLLNTGILQFAQQTNLAPVEFYKQNQAIKRLLMPSEMGELVKVIALNKNCSIPLSGFSTHDRRHCL